LRLTANGEEQMSKVQHSFNVEVDEGLEDGEVVALDAEGKKILHGWHTKKPPPGTHTLKVSARPSGSFIRSAYQRSRQQ
jgi:hypothetical protein